MKKILSIFALILLTSSSIFAQKPDYVPAKSMYMFGVAYSFVDSICYATAVMPVENAYVSRNASKFLYARNEYSYQFKEYLQSDTIKNVMTSSSFSNNRKKAEKKFLKELAKLKKRGFLIKHISADSFKFVGVKYDPPVYEDEENVVKSEKQKKEKGSKKTKDGKFPPKDGKMPPKGMRPPGGSMPGM